MNSSRFFPHSIAVLKVLTPRSRGSGVSVGERDRNLDSSLETPLSEAPPNEGEAISYIGGAR